MPFESQSHKIGAREERDCYRLSMQIQPPEVSKHKRSKRKDEWEGERGREKHSSQVPPPWHLQNEHKSPEHMQELSVLLMQETNGNPKKSPHGCGVQKQRASLLCWRLHRGLVSSWDPPIGSCFYFDTIVFLWATLHWWAVVRPDYRSRSEAELVGKRWGQRGAGSFGGISESVTLHWHYIYSCSCT